MNKATLLPAGEWLKCDVSEIIVLLYAEDQICLEYKSGGCYNVNSYFSTLTNSVEHLNNVQTNIHLQAVRSSEVTATPTSLTHSQSSFYI